MKFTFKSSIKKNPIGVIKPLIGTCLYRCAKFVRIQTWKLNDLSENFIKSFPIFLWFSKIFHANIRLSKILNKLYKTSDWTLSNNLFCTNKKKHEKTFFFYDCFYFLEFIILNYDNFNALEKNMPIMINYFCYLY